MKGCGLYEDIICDIIISDRISIDRDWSYTHIRRWRYSGLCGLDWIYINSRCNNASCKKDIFQELELGRLSKKIRNT